MRRESQRRRSTYRRANAAPRRTLRNRRRPNYALFFCVFALVSSLAAGIAYVFTTPSLHISKVGVKGVHLANASEIDKAASRAIGQNILLLRTGPIIRSVSRQSEIRLVKMGRRFPDKMWLRVWERKADAVLVTEKGCYLTQSDGFVFHQVPQPIKGVPTVHVVGNHRLKVGEMAASPSVKCALDVLRIAHRKAIKLDEISVDPRGDICLNMGSDFCVKLGQPDDIARKMSLLRNALANRPSIVRDGAYIDLSCPSAPVWKPKVASLTAS